MKTTTGSSILTANLEKALKATQDKLMNADVTDDPMVQRDRPDPIRISATVWYELQPSEKKIEYKWSLNQAIRLCTDFETYIKQMAAIEFGLVGQILQEGRCEDDLEVLLLWKGVKGVITRNDLLGYLDGFGLTKVQRTNQEMEKPQWIWKMHPTARIRLRLVGFHFQNSVTNNTL